jgi:hypothetical protein
MQVTARVQVAPSAWATLAAASDLAGRAHRGPEVPMVNLGLARLTVDAVAPGSRALRIRIDYLRN